MLLTLLVGCGLFSSTTTTTCGDTSAKTDTAADTDTTGETAETGIVVPAWTKYKVDSTSTLRGVYSSGQGVYVVASRGQAWVGSATTAWSAVTLPPELGALNLNALWGSGAGDTLELAIAADDGLVATFTGGVWSVWTLGTRDNLGIDGTSLQDLYVVGDNGIQRFDGTAWTVEAAPTVTMNAVWAYTDGAVAVGNEGAVYARSGGTWSQQDTGRAANLFGVGGTSASDVWVVGDQGTILHHGDGSSWSQSTVDTKETLNAVFAGAADGVIVVGNNGAALRYDGSGWTLLDTDTNQNLYGVHGVSATNAWGIGNGGLAMQYKP